jgi:hypothetical protein
MKTMDKKGDRMKIKGDWRVFISGGILDGLTGASFGNTQEPALSREGRGF